jgi:hypothetical protein
VIVRVPFHSGSERVIIMRGAQVIVMIVYVAINAFIEVYGFLFPRLESE